MTRATALILTAMTGFSGLVYEVVWQKYLATLLGSHSEATATVLAIFLGGLSLGYWLFGALTRREIVNAQEAGFPPRLLFIYGCLEFGIGVYVVVFPWLFEMIQALSLAIPHGAGGSGFAIDVLLTVVLVGPATVAMGGTIPILTQALAKDLEDATRFHALVYALNTAGAFAGALAAGFVLIPWLGLVTVLYAMGAINLFAGSVFMLIGRKGGAVVSLSSTNGSLSSRETFHIYHVVALLTGFAMMSLQTTAIRVAGLSFGSSQFTFSMVVAVFVLCIALGSFVVSTFDRISKGWVVANQWLLAIAFAVLYFQVEKSPYWVHVLRTVFRNTDASFAPFHTAAFLSILVMIGLPVVISGAVLPLLFHLMRREADHLGDVSGRLYGWNTVGSLLGALLGGYVLF
ncbi:MAG: fused MFS/spermidine synthase, partial [Myxococcota bacterium]